MKNVPKVIAPNRPADDPLVVLHTATEQLTVEVIGELDKRAARELQAILSRAIGGGRRTVHLDLSRVSFITQPGTKALAAAAATAAIVGAQVAVVRPSDPARRALHEAGLDGIVLTDIDLTDPKPEAPA